MAQKNELYYGDNLEVLPQRVGDETVDLIYLDPPFNSKRSYNVLFKRKSGEEPPAQIQAFDDTWTWDQGSQAAYQELVGGSAPVRVADTIEAMRRMLGENDVLAYLVMMTPRLLELHRVLKPTGSVYLHCDPTASHYLKLMMDSVFGPENFLNEVVWLYGLGGSSSRYWPRKHDTIFWYSKMPNGHYFKADQIPATSHRMEGQLKKAPDYWAIPTINNKAKERLGYPTQKPLELLKRIVRSSSRPGELVLDPFCGCGTTVDAAQQLGRRWIGIDITYLAVDLIDKRLRHSYGDSVASTYEIHGIPRDLEGAHALFARSPLDFERWSVSLVGGQPNAKQVGDKGSDGVIRIPTDAKGLDIARVVVSVKGGQQQSPYMVRDLIGTVGNQHAEMGLLVTMGTPTRGMVEAANHSGIWTHPANGTKYPNVQIISIPELMEGKKPNLPPAQRPYIEAAKHAVESSQLTL